MVRNIHAASRRDRKKARRCYRCLLNGEDVTVRTYYADDKAGIVRMLRRDASGRLFVGPSGIVATEQRHGKVRLECR